MRKIILKLIDRLEFEGLLILGLIVVIFGFTGAFLLLSCYCGCGG